MISLKPHNQKAKEEILNAFREGAKSVIYTSCVGTGKSFVFMALLDYFGNGKTMYIVPKHAVTENMTAYKEFASLSADIDGIDGIVLFRNITSVPVLQQVIGRVCSIGKKESPVIIDCSASAVELMKKLMAENEKGMARPISGTGCKEIVRIGLADEARFDIEVFLRETSKSRLPDAAVSALKKYRELGGGEYESVLSMDRKALDYQKLRVCCQMYRLPVRYFADHNIRIA